MDIWCLPHEFYWHSLFTTLPHLIILAKIYWNFHVSTLCICFCRALYYLTFLYSIPNPQICSPLGRWFPYNISYMSFPTSGLICVPFPPSLSSAHAYTTCTQGSIQILPCLSSSPWLFLQHSLSLFWIVIVLCTVLFSI